MHKGSKINDIIIIIILFNNRQAKANSGFVTTKRSEANYSEKIRYTMQTEFFSETYDVLIGYKDRCKPMQTDAYRWINRIRLIHRYSL